MQYCSACGGQVQEGRQFCRHCGASVEVAAPVTAGVSAGGSSRMTRYGASDVPRTVGNGHAGAEPRDAERTIPLNAPVKDQAQGFQIDPAGPSENGRARRRRVTARGILGAVSLVVIAAILSVGALGDLGVRHHLRTARQTLASSRNELAATTAQLTSMSEELRRAQLDLASRTKERDAARATVRNLRATIGRLQGRVGSLQGQTSLQAGQISVLKGCLSGVSVALDDVLNLDYSAAASALISVQSDCNTAFQLL